MLLVAPERHMLHLRTPHRAAPGGNARASRPPKPPISPPLTVQAPIGTRWGGSLTLARTPTPTLTLTPISLLTPTLTESETRTGNPESRDKSAQEGLWACSLHAQRLARPRRASVQQLRLSRAESGFVEELN